tara:strand:- start:29 stop:343 length:315 start_codon:yes stop_codon:yes gene_type:complete
MARRPALWEQIEKPWDDLDIVWQLFEFFVDIFYGKKKENYKNIYEKLDKEKKKKVVKLICMVKGRKIEEVKEVEDFEISIDDVDLVLERARKLKPQLFVENISE